MSVVPSTNPSEEAAVPQPLSGAEQAVLFAIDDLWSDEFCGPFISLQHQTGLDRKAVRQACRSLAAKGLARYQRGLFDDDGQVAGAGYGLTRAGAALVWEMASSREGTDV